MVVSTYLKSWSLHRKCVPDGQGVVKVISVQTYLEIQTHPSRKLKLQISNLRFHTATWLINWRTSDFVLKLARIFHQDLRRQLFSLKKGYLFQNHLMYVQCYNSVRPWRKKSQCNCAFVKTFLESRTTQNQNNFFLSLCSVQHCLGLSIGYDFQKSFVRIPWLQYLDV